MACGRRRSKVEKEKIWWYSILLILCLWMGCCFHTVTTKATTTKEHDKVIETNGIEVLISKESTKLLRIGRTAEVEIEIRGKEIGFCGSVEVVVPDANKDSIVYQKKVDVLPNRTKQVTVAFEIINKFRQYQLRLVQKGGDIMLNQTMEVTVDTSMEAIYIGVLATNHTRYSYLETDTTKVHPIQLEDFSSHKGGLNAFDILVVDDFDTHQMSKEQYNNLISWVCDGGTIVLGTGKQYERVLSVFLKEKLFEFQVDGLQEKQVGFDMTASELDMLTQHLLFKKNIADSFQKEKMTVLSGRMQEGIEVVYEDGTVLLEKMNYSQGAIELFHVSLKRSDQRGTVLDEVIRKLILDHMSKTRKLELQEGTFCQNVSNYKYTALPTQEDTRFPHVAIYCVTVGIYIFLIGPVLYIILSKKDRKHLVWPIVIMVSLVCSVLLFVIGTKTRITHLQGNYFNVLYLDKEKSTETIVFSLITPFQGEYEVRLPQSVQVQPLNHHTYWYYMEEEEELTLKSEGRQTIEFGSALKEETYQKNETDEVWEGTPEVTKIRIEQYPSFSPLYYSVKNNFTFEEEFDATLTYTLDGVRGSLHNQLGFDLSNAVLVGAGSLHGLGTLKDGSTLKIGDQPAKPLLSRDYYLLNDFLEQLAGKEMETEKSTEIVTRKVSAYNYFIEEYMKQSQKKSYVIGFYEPLIGGSIGKELAEQFEVTGLQMVVIPVTIDGRDGRKEYVPFLGEPMKVLEGNYSLGDEYRYFDGSLVVEYQFQSDEVIDSLHYTENLNLPFASEEYTGFTGEIRVWNTKTNQYDMVLNANNRNVTNVSDYISKNHELIVKYQASHMYSDYYMTLPYISYTKEVVANAVDE